MSDVTEQNRIEPTRLTSWIQAVGWYVRMCFLAAFAVVGIVLLLSFIDPGPVALYTGFTVSPETCQTVERWPSGISDPMGDDGYRGPNGACRMADQYGRFEYAGANNKPHCEYVAEFMRVNPLTGRGWQGFWHDFCFDEYGSLTSWEEVSNAPDWRGWSDPKITKAELKARERQALGQ